MASVPEGVIADRGRIQIDPLVGAVANRTTSRETCGCKPHNIQRNVRLQTAPTHSPAESNESFAEFKNSFAYGARTDLNFKFLKNLSDADAAMTAAQRPVLWQFVTI